MPSVDLQFNSNMNASIQQGDVVYKTVPQSTGTQSDSFLSGSINSTYLVGTVTHACLPCETSTGRTYGITIFIHPVTGTTPNTGDYLMFSKNKVANTSGLLGYYADITLSNDSKKRAELFSVGSEVAISSK